MRAVRKLPSYGMTPFDATDVATHEAVRIGVAEDGLLIARRAAPGVFTYYYWSTLREWQAGVDENFRGDPYVIIIIIIIIIVIVIIIICLQLSLNYFLILCSDDAGRAQAVLELTVQPSDGKTGATPLQYYLTSHEALAALLDLMNGYYKFLTDDERLGKARAPTRPLLSNPKDVRPELYFAPTQVCCFVARQ